MTLGDAAGKLGYLLKDEMTVDEAAKAKAVDTEQGQAVIAATIAALEAQEDWTTPNQSTKR